MHARRILQHNIRPSLEHRLSYVQLPANLAQECSLVDVDLVDRKSRHLTPRLRGIVAILEVLRSQYERGQEHPASAHKRAVRRAIAILLFGEVLLGHERLDQYQVVQRHLQRRIACARSPERLFNVHTEWQNATLGTLSLFWAMRKWPDDLNHLCGGVFMRESLADVLT